MSAHGFTPVARNLVNPAIISRTAGARVSCICVDGGETSQHNRPMIVIELVREEERAGKAVILRTVVAVMLVRGDRMPSKTIVLCHISRQAVVMAHK